MIKEILKLIEAIFDALFKPQECRLKRSYVEYIPGTRLNIPQDEEVSYSM